jgi:N-acetylglucosaminyldiphosphoundecaprenol N-acetyl-beta-D-mannosaminyltransferase
MFSNYIIFKKSLKDIDLNSKRIINTINPHSYCVAKKDFEFHQSLELSDVLLPDGVGIIWAEKLINGNRIKKIAGYDLFLFLMEQLEKDKGTVFFLGASNDTLNKIESKCKLDFPNVTVGGYSPPYKFVFTEKDSKAMCEAVNAVKPDVLFVGMTAPKQEKWVHKFKDELKVTNICCIGAVFDFYAGNIKRSSDFWINLGFEWLPRLIKEPKRLFHRNFVSTPKFILEVLSFKIFGKGIL